MANGGTEPERKEGARWPVNATGVWEPGSAQLAAAPAK